MLLSADRERVRGFFQEVRRKQLAGTALEPLEAIVGTVIGEHPEYHRLLDDPDARRREFGAGAGARVPPETNPFLHMGMHVAIHEQIGSDRPPGIRALYQRLLPAFDAAHTLEHAMMECLGEVLWIAQRDAKPPDEERYLECVRRLGGR